MFLEAGFDRALVELEISTNVPYPLTQNLGSDFVLYPKWFKNGVNCIFVVFVKKPVPDMGGDSKKFLRPTSFGKQPKRLLSPKAHFRFPKNRTISLKRKNLFKACLFEIELFVKKRKSEKSLTDHGDAGIIKTRFR